MPSRRHFLTAAALLGLSACAVPPGLPGAATLGTREALLDWILARPDQASVLVDDGRGTTVDHLADRPRPIASAVKAVHLLAYAQAVAGGTLDPAAPVAVRDWERWYVAGADGGAHPAAVQSLGVDANATVTWDDVVVVMIDFSDNAAADLVAEILGDDALAAAAASVGWAPFDPARIAGEDLYALAPDPSADRRAATLTLGRAWAAGEATARALGGQYATRSAASIDWNRDVEIWEGSWAATAEQLAGLHRASATGALGEPVGAIVRRHLERGPADKLPDGVLGFGQKGGGLPGILSMAGSVRRADGTIGAVAVILSRLTVTEFSELMTSPALLRFAQQALLDDEWAARLRDAL